MKKPYCSLIVVVLFQFFPTFCGQRAVVVQPVIDLLGSPVAEMYGNSDISMYQKFGLSPVDKKDFRACPRIHQLLYNEQVTIVKEQGDEVLVEVPQVFYQLEKDGARFNQFWTLRSHVVALQDLLDKGVDISKIPPPCDATHGNDFPESKILTLLFPFYSPVTHMLYSAGTRFVYSQLTENDEYVLYAVNSSHATVDSFKIPKVLCLIMDKATRQEKIEKFVDIMQQWAHLPSGFIPCVLGGTSFTQTCNDEQFYNQSISVPNGASSSYAYPSYQEAIKTGFDCSGLIYRVAQMCKIPFFYKNSTTIGLNMPEITAQDEIAAGDLIWIPKGHVIVITDVKNGLCVEVRDYSHGYGKLHEVSIDTIFKNVRTFAQLKQAAMEKLPMYMLDNNQTIVREISHFKLLKMSSVWDHATAVS